MTVYDERLQSIIDRTLRLVREARPAFNESFTESSAAMQFCELRMAGKEREEFMVMYLNSQHQLIEDRIEFVGTINSTAVYPREIAKHCLKVNAAAVILCHNHPSGSLEPSHADIRLTEEIKQGLKFLDVSLLDHIIVGDGATSLAQRGAI